jgi:hypothetical protein
LVILVGSVVHHAIALVVESGGRVGIPGVGGSENNSQKNHSRQELHDLFLSGKGRTM